MRFVWRWIAYKMCGYSIEMVNQPMTNPPMTNPPMNIEMMKSAISNYLKKTGVIKNNGQQPTNMSTDDVKKAYNMLKQMDLIGGKRRTYRSKSYKRSTRRNKSHKRH